MTRNGIVNTPVYFNEPTQVLISFLVEWANEQGLKGNKVSELKFEQTTYIYGSNCFVSAEVEQKQQPVHFTMPSIEIILYFEAGNIEYIKQLPGFEIFHKYERFHNTHKYEIGRIVTPSAIFKLHNSVVNQSTTIEKKIIAD